jgi:hypothetical protein
MHRYQVAKYVIFVIVTNILASKENFTKIKIKNFKMRLSKK